MAGSNDRLNELYERFLADIATRHELQEFWTLVKEMPEDHPLHQRVYDMFTEVEVQEQLQRDWSSATEKIFGAEDSPSSAPVHRVHLLKRAWVRYAAAAMMVLCVGAYMWLSERSKMKDERLVLTSDTSADVLPGANRAVLTLGDGRTIVLDSAENFSRKGVKDSQKRKEDLELEQGITVKKSDGSIDYSENGPVIPSEARNLIFHKLATPRGGQYQLTLPDGSRVWLNAASSITYPSAFSGKERSVSITGEVYFEVAKNKAIPFIVNTTTEKITVLGTEFNVKAYKDEGDVETVLVEGSVKVSAASAPLRTSAPPRETKLKPGEAYSNGKVTKANISQVTAWKKGNFYFDDQDLKSILQQFSRWYDVEVVYEGTLKNRTFFGIISRDKPLSHVLKLLQDNNIQFRIEGRKLYVVSD